MLEFKEEFWVCFYLKAGTDLSMLVLLRERASRECELNKRGAHELRARFLRQWLAGMGMRM